MRVKFRPLLLPVGSFVAGAAVLAAFRMGMDGVPADPDRDSAVLSALLRTAPDRPPGGVAVPGGSDIGGGSILAFTGLSAPPTLDDIFNAHGMDRTLRMAVFLRTASSADMEKVIAQCRERKIRDKDLTDLVWLRWVDIDREAAFKADPGGNALWWAWGKLDPAAAVAAAAEAKPENLQEVIRSIGQSDHSAAIQLLSEYPAADTSLVWEGILNGLGKTDQGAAAALAMERNLKPDEYIGEWVASEPERAMEWARGLEDPVQHRRALDFAVKALTHSDPAAALRESSAMPAGRARTERQAEVIAALARTDPAAAREVAEGLENPSERRIALSHLAETLATRDSAAALAIMKGFSWKDPPGTLTWTYEDVRGRSTGGTSTETDQSAVRLLMETAPEAMANLLAGLPADRQAPLGTAVGHWVGREPEAASRWLNGQAAGPEKDEAIEALTDWLVRTSPEPDFDAALAWAAAVSTSELQFSKTLQTLEVWRGKDWKAARDAVDRLPLTPEQRETILKDFN